MFSNSPNPFVVGTPVIPERFVGRKSLIEVAFDQIHSCGHLAVWGGLGTGKTSLLHKLAYPQTWQQQNLDSSSAVIVYFSCEEIQPFTSSSFWTKVTSLIRDHLQNEPDLQQEIDTILIKNTASRENLRQILKELSKKGKKLVLLVDDYDVALFENPNYSQENMQQLLSECRNLAVYSDGKRNLSVIVTSKKRLNDLGPQLNPNQSPWYNHYLFRQLREFENSEIQQILAPFNKPITPELSQAIIEITGGHPALLQIAAFLLYQHLRDNDIPEVETFITDFQSSTQHFFANIWQRCSSKEQNLLMLLALSKLSGRLQKKQYDIKDVDLIFTQSERILTNLEEQCVIKREKNNGSIPYLFNSSLMEKWVIQEMYSDENWLKQRQKEFLNLMSHKQAENVKSSIIWVKNHRDDVMSGLKFMYPIFEKILRFFIV